MNWNTICAEGITLHMKGVLYMNFEHEFYEMRKRIHILWYIHCIKTALVIISLLIELARRI